jgi:hypothetical protein
MHGETVKFTSISIIISIRSHISANVRNVLLLIESHTAVLMIQLFQLFIISFGKYCFIFRKIIFSSFLCFKTR